MTSVLVISVLLAQQLATTLPEYLRTRGFTQEELTSIEGGAPIVKIIETEHETETELMGAVKIGGEPEEFIARYRDIVSFERGTGVLQIGLFSKPPDVADLKSLTLDPEDIEDLKDCQPGECDLKVSDRTIAEFRKIDWRAENADPKAQALARQMMAEFVKAYQEGGNEALGTLHDKEEPLRVKKQFDEMIESPDLPAYLPGLDAFLKDYPTAGTPGTEDLFYWSKVDFGLKPLIRLNHVVIYQPQDGGIVKYAMASKMLYATHYFNTGVEMKALVEAKGSPAAYYLMVSNQSRSDGLTGLTGSLIGGRVRREARDGLVTYLAAVKKNLESSPP